MKTRSFAAAAVMMLLLVAAWPAPNWAQDGKPTPESDALREQEIALRKSAEAQKFAEKAMAQAADDLTRVEEIRIRKSFPGWTGAPGPKFVTELKGHPRHLTQIQEVAERYRDGVDESQKAKALDELQELVSKYFEEDMQIRKQELADIEARLEKLRSQLERRRAKKDEIVDLQMKVAINEAEGLGFTSVQRDNFMINFRAPAYSDLALPPVKVEVAVPAPPVPPAGVSRQLGIGAEGDAVRELQQALNERMEPSPDLTVDGDFGPETEKALKAFQSKHDLEASGVVDEATRAKLDVPLISDPASADVLIKK